MIKLIAFDWNGTIIADTNAAVKANTAVRRQFGFPDTTLQEMQKDFVIPIKDYWVNSGFDLEIFEKNASLIEEVFMRNYEPQEAQCRSRTGTRQLLEWLQKEGVEAVVFSNHIVPHIEKQSTRLKIRSYFSKILARRPGERTHYQKSFKDASLTEYVNSKNYKPEEVITVGDTIEEIEIGKRYGYHTIAVTGGYQSVKRLKEANPDFLINNLIDLKEIVENFKLHGRIT